MSRFWRGLGWGVALLLTALVSWMTTLYQGWPWWWLVPMSVLGGAGFVGLGAITPALDGVALAPSPWRGGH